MIEGKILRFEKFPDCGIYRVRANQVESIAVSHARDGEQHYVVWIVRTLSGDSVKVHIPREQVDQTRILRQWEEAQG
jgi:hypothetical protein